MPRQARLDAPGTLHHVMLRGIERRAIVTDDADRHEFVSAWEPRPCRAEHPSMVGPC